MYVQIIKSRHGVLSGGAQRFELRDGGSENNVIKEQSIYTVLLCYYYATMATLYRTLTSI